MNNIKNICSLILISFGLIGCNGSSEGENSLRETTVTPKSSEGDFSFDRKIRANVLNHPSDLSLGDYNISLSYQGNVMVTNRTNSKGSTVRMYTKQDNQWTLANNIKSNSPTFGAVFTVSSNGQYIFISDKYEGTQNSGKVFIYKYNEKEKEFFVAQEIINTDIKNNGNFGSSISTSTNGKLLVISADQNRPIEGKKGGVFTYKFSENLDMWEFNQELKFNPGESYFGAHLTVSGNGNTIIVSDIGGNVYVYENDHDQFVRKATLKKKILISSVSINKDGTSFTVSGFDGELFHYEAKKNGGYTELLITKPIRDADHGYPGYDFAKKAQISQSGDVMVVSADSDYYVPPVDFMVSGKNLKSLLTKKEECPSKYSWSSETTKIQTGASLVYKRNATGNWSLHQYLKPDLSKIRSYNGKDICDQDYLNGYKGDRSLNNGISFSLSSGSLVQTTINGQIIEYTNE